MIIFNRWIDRKIFFKLRNYQQPDSHIRNIECLALMHFDKNKDKKKKYKKTWNKNKYLIKNIDPENNDSENHSYKYLKLESFFDDNLPITGELEVYDVVVIARSAFYDNKKIYLSVKSVPSGVVGFNYFLLQKVNQLINKAVSVMLCL